MRISRGIRGHVIALAATLSCWLPELPILRQHLKFAISVLERMPRAKDVAG